ncbi:hypothetical protein [Neobacillus sp. 19]|uniref:hypothetical protein n=1 Tax=Neobacillus sp. 19 TaxID=3394458 RepID=UPI003BF6A668
MPDPKGIVKLQEDQTIRTFVQPIDKDHKEPLIVSESLLSKIAPEAEPLHPDEENIQGSLYDF